MSRWKSGLTSEEGWPSVHTCACLRVRVCTYARLCVQLRLGTAGAVHKKMQERRCPGAGGALLGVCRAESGGARVRRGKPAATVQAPKSQPPGALLALREIAPATYTRPLRGSGENPRLSGSLAVLCLCRCVQRFVCVCACSSPACCLHFSPTAAHLSRRLSGLGVARQSRKLCLTSISPPTPAFLSLKINK